MWLTKETLKRFVVFVSTTGVFEIPLMQRCLNWNQRGIVLLLLLLLQLVLLLLSAFMLLPLLWLLGTTLLLLVCFVLLLLWALLLQHEVTSPTLISLKKMTMTYTFFLLVRCYSFNFLMLVNKFCRYYGPWETKIQ